jgi:transposase
MRRRSDEKKIGELIEQQGCEILLFLPASYSPDYNPVEEALAKIKTCSARLQPGAERLR